MNAPAKPLEIRVRGVCDSGKYSYSTEAYAWRWAEKIKDAGDHNKVYTKAYYCKVCNGWHLTSKPQGRGAPW